VSVVDITGDVKCSRKAGSAKTNDKKTSEVDLVKVFRIKKQIGDPQILSEASCNHCKQNNPAKHENMVTLEVIQ
jgi:hypothetical protein